MIVVVVVVVVFDMRFCVFIVDDGSMRRCRCCQWEGRQDGKEDGDGIYYYFVPHHQSVAMHHQPRVILSLRPCARGVDNNTKQQVCWSPKIPRRPCA